MQPARVDIFILIDYLVDLSVIKCYGELVSTYVILYKVIIFNINDTT